MRSRAPSLPYFFSKSSRNTRKAMAGSVVVPDLEMTLMEKRLPLVRRMMSLRAVGEMVLPQK